MENPDELVLMGKNMTQNFIKHTGWDSCEDRGLEHLIQSSKHRLN